MGIPFPRLSILTKIKQHPLFNSVKNVFILDVFIALISISCTIILSNIISVANFGIYQHVLSFIALGHITTLPGMTIVTNKGALLNNSEIFFKAVARSITTTVVFVSLLFISCFFAFKLG